MKVSARSGGLSRAAFVVLNAAWLSGLFGCAAISSYRQSIELQEDRRWCDAAKSAKEAYLARSNNDVYYAQYCEMGLRCHDERWRGIDERIRTLPNVVPEHERLLVDLEDLLDFVDGFNIYASAVRSGDLSAQLSANEDSRLDLLLTLKKARKKLISDRSELVQRYETLIAEATSSINNGDYDKAEKSIADAASIWPEKSIIQQMGEFLVAREQIQAAAPRTGLEILKRDHEWYSQATAAMEKHIDMATKLIEEGEANVSRAKREIDRGRWDRARTYLDRATESDREHPALASFHRYIDTCVRAEELLALADELRAIGEYERADGMALGLSIAGKRHARLVGNLSRRHIAKAQRAQADGSSGRALVEYLAVLRVDPGSTHAVAGIQGLFEKARSADRVRIGVSIRGGNETPAGSLRATILEALVDGDLAEEARITDVSRYLGDDDLGFNHDALEKLSGHFDYLIDVDVITAYSDAGESLAAQRDKRYIERYETRVVPNPEWDRYQKQLAESAGNSVGNYVAEQAGGGLWGALAGMVTASAVENAVEPPKTITIQEPVHGTCTYQQSRCHATAMLKSQVRLVSLPSGDELERQVLSEKENCKDTGTLLIAGDCRKASVHSEQCSVRSEYDLMETATRKLTRGIDSISTSRLSGKNRLVQAASIAESRGDTEAAIDLFFKSLVVRYPSDNWREPMMAVVRLAGEDYHPAWEKTVRSSIR